MPGVLTECESKARDQLFWPIAPCHSSKKVLLLKVWNDSRNTYYERLRNGMSV